MIAEYTTTNAQFRETRRNVAGVQLQLRTEDGAGAGGQRGAVK